MNIVLIFWAGVAIGAGGILLWQRVAARRKKPLNDVRSKETLIERQKREKEEDKARILGIFDIDPKLTVSHIEQYFGIPESTATRYFDELEKEGKVRQVGEAGRGVHI